MALTTAQAFDSFDSRIRLSASDETRAKDRFARVQTYLSGALPADAAAPLASTHRMGSVFRGAATRPLGDIDTLAVLSNANGAYDKWRYDSTAFLAWVRHRINAKTSVQKVGARGQAVRLFYTDGLWVDIAPVFRYDTGGYALPAGDRSWLKVDPLVQNEWAARRNRELGYRLNRIVRMLKKWNTAHSSRLGSWHMYVMAGHLFASLNGNSRTALRLFFANAADWLRVSDPDGLQGDVSAYLTWNERQAAINSFSSARQRIDNALNAEVAGDHAEAKRMWRIVLGSDFPTG